MCSCTVIALQPRLCKEAGCAWCRQAGGVEPLVLLLQGGQDKRAIKNASWALANLAKSNADNKAAIREAKGIQVRQPTHVAAHGLAMLCAGCMAVQKGCECNSRTRVMTA